MVDLKFATLELRDDKKAVMESVKRDGYTLEYASSRLQNDEEVALEAIKHRNEAWRFIPDELKDDKDFLEKVFSVNPCIRYCI